jgi:2-keto-4-pentenoate hydratase
MPVNAVDEAARLLSAARSSGTLLDALPEALRPTSVEQAHAIQVATAARLRDAIGGWKVATTSERRVARGGLLRSRMVPSGATLASSLVPLLGVEAEIAFRFDRDLLPQAAEYSYDEVAAAVTALMAIEVVDSRYRGYPNLPLLDRIADFMSNGAFVYGDALPGWRSVDLAALDVELTLDGQSIVRRVGGHPTKDPLLPAIALVNDLRRDAGLSVGQIVTTGTYTGLNYAKPGQIVKATFHGLGAVQVRFDASR